MLTTNKQLEGAKNPICSRSMVSCLTSCLFPTLHSISEMVSTVAALSIPLLTVTFYILRITSEKNSASAFKLAVKIITVLWDKRIPQAGEMSNCVSAAGGSWGKWMGEHPHHHCWLFTKLQNSLWSCNDKAYLIVLDMKHWVRHMSNENSLFSS